MLDFSPILISDRLRAQLVLCDSSLRVLTISSHFRHRISVLFVCFRPLRGKPILRLRLYYVLCDFRQPCVAVGVGVGVCVCVCEGAGVGVGVGVFRLFVIRFNLKLI